MGKNRWKRATGVHVLDVKLRCQACGDTCTLTGPADEFREWVASEVGHPMPTVGLALAHLCCPSCGDTGMVRDGASVVTL